jgi:hypothetical protein
MALSEERQVAAAGCRKVGGTSIQSAVPQRFERLQCLKTVCSNEYLALRESVGSAESEGSLTSLTTNRHRCGGKRQTQQAGWTFKPHPGHIVKQLGHRRAALPDTK